jgi:hypothetical protein
VGINGSHETDVASGRRRRRIKLGDEALHLVRYRHRLLSLNPSGCEFRNQDDRVCSYFFLTGASEEFLTRSMSARHSCSLL